MPTSMILRFRDLSGPIGSTIVRHREIRDAHGSVWWAWWWKPSERVPRDLFSAFKQQIIQNGHLNIYLADSGQYLLYRARLVEIRESETEDPIPSPDPPLTPEYYRATPYKAWFRLSEFEEIPGASIEG